MRRMLLLVGCLLLTGCSGAPGDSAQEDKSQQPNTSNSSTNDADAPVKAPAGSTSAVEAAYDFLGCSYRGERVEVVHSKEEAVSTPKTRATALHVEWQLQGKDERFNHILIIQDGNVVSMMECQPGKSFEANVAAAVKEFESR